MRLFFFYFTIGGIKTGHGPVNSICYGKEETNYHIVWHSLANLMAKSS